MQQELGQSETALNRNELATQHDCGGQNLRLSFGGNSGPLSELKGGRTAPMTIGATRGPEVCTLRFNDKLLGRA